LVPLTFVVTVADVRNLGLAAKVPETWRLPTFTMIMADVRNPILAAEALETWRLPNFAVTVADDVEVQTWSVRLLRLGACQLLL